MMPSKYRILSFHYIANNGAFLFAYSLAQLLHRNFHTADVKVLDYRSPRLALYEYLKRFKWTQRMPLFYWKRSQLWRNTINRNLNLDRDYPHFTGQKTIQRYFSDHFDALIVGMDVWCIVKGTERPLFPNIYWLPEKMGALKIAYGVSGYNSDRTLIQKYEPEISRYLNDFDIIGSRDRFTHDLVTRYRTRASGLVEMVPDPTFMYDIQPTGVQNKLSQIGVDFNRPIVGILLFGHDALSQAIKSHYKSKGYQILALSMYNPYADFNLGHVLDPFEWAEAFRLLSFCITDRFHGAILCLKNQTPFISLEKDSHLPKSQSKMFDLLYDFDLSRCYVNPGDEKFNSSSFLQDAGEIEANWTKSLESVISSKIDAIKDRHQEFLRRMKREISRGP
jgi:hypothetical protein